jgi:hypothetical protein
MNLETSFNHGGHGERGERLFAVFYGLTQRVNAKRHAICCFYSVFFVPSVVIELGFLR